MATSWHGKSALEGPVAGESSSPAPRRSGLTPTRRLPVACSPRDLQTRSLRRSQTPMFLDRQRDMHRLAAIHDEDFRRGAHPAQRVSWLNSALSGGCRHFRLRPCVVAGVRAAFMTIRFLYR